MRGSWPDQPVSCREEQRGGLRTLDEVRQRLFGLEAFDVFGAEVNELDGKLIVKVTPAAPGPG